MPGVVAGLFADMISSTSLDHGLNVGLLWQTAVANRGRKLWQTCVISLGLFREFQTVVTWNGTVDGIGEVGQTSLAKPAAEQLGNTSNGRVGADDSVPSVCEEVFVRDIGVGSFRETRQEFEGERFAKKTDFPAKGHGQKGRI